VNTHRDLGELTRSILEQNWKLEREDLGGDAHLAKKGMAFDTEAWTAAGLGHLCVMRMKAFLGLMKMETVVLSVTGRDLPLLNLDWVSAAGKETQIAELYDTQLEPFPAEKLAIFQALKDRDGDLPDPPAAGEHWYDAILYPCSYHKAGRKLSERFNAAAESYLRAFAGMIAEAPVCDEAEKGAKVRAFAETLVEKGGPAVDTVTKLFGAETARRLILGHMYGVRD
jgi:hypothetical protein